METIILFAPLVGALICGFGWRLIGEKAAQWTATGFLFLAAFLSWIIFLTFDPFAHESGAYTVSVLRWIESGSLSTDWAIRMDRLTAIMLIVVTTGSRGSSITVTIPDSPMVTAPVGASLILAIGPTPALVTDSLVPYPSV